MKRLVIHDAASAELDEAIGWYNSQHAGLGRALHAAVREALDRICESPDVGLGSDLTPFRVCLTRGFPYAVYYLELEEVVWVAAIAHLRRRPQYWKGRTPDGRK